MKSPRATRTFKPHNAAFKYAFSFHETVSHIWRLLSSYAAIHVQKMARKLLFCYSPGKHLAQQVSLNPSVTSQLLPTYFLQHYACFPTLKCPSVALHCPVRSHPAISSSLERTSKIKMLHSFFCCFFLQFFTFQCLDVNFSLKV